MGLVKESPLLILSNVGKIGRGSMGVVYILIIGHGPMLVFVIKVYECLLFFECFCGDCVIVLFI